MAKTAFFNNKYQPFSETFLHISDLVIHRGYGIFDFMLERNGRVPFIGEYIDRLIQSASLMKLELKHDRKAIEGIIYNLLLHNKFHNSSIKLLLTGGYSEDGYTPQSPNFIVINHPFPLPETNYKEGVTLLTVEYQREMPEAKSINYMTSLVNLPAMKDKSALDVLYHRNGNIYECSRCNFFLVRKGVLITPGSGMLRGVTRKNVVKVANGICKVEERNVAVSEIKEADEAFVTCTTKDVLPVAKIDDVIIGNGKIGELTGILNRKYSELLQSF